MTLYSFIRSQAEQQQLVSPVPGDSVARHDTGNIQGQVVGIMKGSSGLAILHRARNEPSRSLKLYNHGKTKEKTLLDINP